MVSAGISIYNREYLYIFIFTHVYIYFSACQSFTISHFGDQDHLGPDFVHPCGGSPVVFGFVSLWLLMMWFAFHAFSD